MYLTVSHCSASVQELVKNCGRKIFFSSFLTSGKIHYTKSQKFLKRQRERRKLFGKVCRRRSAVLYASRGCKPTCHRVHRVFIQCRGKLCLCHALPSSHHLASSPWANSIALFGESVHGLYRETTAAVQQQRTMHWGHLRQHIWMHETNFCCLFEHNYQEMKIKSHFVLHFFKLLRICTTDLCSRFLKAQCLIKLNVRSGFDLMMNALESAYWLLWRRS